MWITLTWFYSAICAHQFIESRAHMIKSSAQIRWLCIYTLSFFYLNVSITLSSEHSSPFKAASHFFTTIIKLRYESEYQAFKKLLKSARSVWLIGYSNFAIGVTVRVLSQPCDELLTHPGCMLLPNVS